MTARYRKRVLMESTATGAQTAQRASSPPPVERACIPICCLCKRIRDEIGRPADGARWITPRTFQKIHGVKSVDCLHTHTYCPGCLSRAMKSSIQEQIS